jgi:hypothetical protein
MPLLHAPPHGFWLRVVNPGFITCHDPVQKAVIFFAITSQVAGTNVSAHALMLICQFLRYPPGAHVMQLKLPYTTEQADPTLIFSCFAISLTVTLLF